MSNSHPHYQKVKDLMKEKELRGNPKDYVILTDDMMVDYRSAYKIDRIDKDTESNMLLVHKKWLHRFVKKEVAEMFWNLKIRMRVNKFLKPDKIVNVRRGSKPPTIRS